MGKAKYVVHTVSCIYCNTDFEADEKDTGKPPFTVECPNCGAECEVD